MVHQQMGMNVHMCGRRVGALEQEIPMKDLLSFNISLASLRAKQCLSQLAQLCILAVEHNVFGTK